MATFFALGNPLNITEITYPKVTEKFMPPLTLKNVHR